MARLVLETAVVHSRFASVRADEGIFLSKSWLDVYAEQISIFPDMVLTLNSYGVFLASLVLILSGFWSYETHSAGQLSVTSHQQLQARRQCLRIIQKCAADDQVSKVLSLVLESLASAIDRGAVRVAGDPMLGLPIDSQSASGSSFANTDMFKALEPSEQIDLSSCSFFLVGGRSLDYEPELEGRWGSNCEAFHSLAEYISRHIRH
jgi:hypothetical protein